LTLIGNHVKCKRFFKIAGSEQAGLPLDGMVLNGMTGVLSYRYSLRVPYNVSFKSLTIWKFFMKKLRWIKILYVILILAMGLVACNNGPDPLRPTANFEFDVLVVGSGMAGLSAAMKAHEAGASVVVIEKLATIGGASATSGGGIGASGSSVQQEFGIEDNVETYWQHFLMRNDKPLHNSSFKDFLRSRLPSG